MYTALLDGAGLATSRSDFVRGSTVSCRSRGGQKPVGGFPKKENIEIWSVVVFGRFGRLFKKKHSDAACLNATVTHKSLLVYLLYQPNPFREWVLDTSVGR